MKYLENKYIKKLIYLMPLIPILSVIDKNKNENHFDISIFFYYLIFYFFLLFLINIFPTRIKIKEFLKKFITSFLTIFICYGFISKLFTNGIFFAHIQFYIIILTQLVLLTIILYLLLRQKILSLVIIISFISIPFFSILFNGANISFNFFEKLNIVKTSFTNNAKKNSANKKAIDKNFVNRNVYIFIFDAYQRSDILKKFYNHSNDNFISNLEKKGFITFKNSRSSFRKTTLSLNSMLGLLEKNYSEKKLLKTLNSKYYTLHSNNVYPPAFRVFKENNYQVWTFNHYGEKPKNCETCLKWESLLKYEDIQFLKMTPLYDFLMNNTDFNQKIKSTIVNDSYLTYQTYLKYNNNKVSNNLFFSHVLMPHPPYALNENCKYKKNFIGISLNEAWTLKSSELNKDYLSQVMCANIQMIKLSNEIIKNDPNSTIIFASDHGWKTSHAIEDKINKSKLPLSDLQLLFRNSNFISIRDPSSCFKDNNDFFYLNEIFPKLFKCLGFQKEEWPVLKGTFSYNKKKNRLEEYFIPEKF